METNTRLVEVGGEVYDVPVEVYSRAMAEAELTVWRRRLVEDLAAVGDPEADARLEAAWATSHMARPADLIRLDTEAVLAVWDAYEDRQRARLRLPPRHQDS